MNLDSSQAAGGAPTPEALRRRRRVDAWQRLIAFGVLVAPTGGSLVVSFAITPDAIESGSILLSPPCTFKALLGIPCLSCGMTRAFAALSHGQLGLAWSYNALSPFFYLAFWGLTAYGLYGAWHAARDLLRREAA